MLASSRPRAVFGRGRFRGNRVTRRDLDMRRMTATNYTFPGHENNTRERKKEKRSTLVGRYGGGGGQREHVLIHVSRKRAT